jgi:hypothetical protein
MNRTLKIAAIAAALLVAIHQEIKDFFAARGCNPAYLGLEKSAVPAVEWAKIQAVLNVADDTEVMTDDPVYMDLGNHRWIYEQDTDDD